eukprot:scaffold4071_cov217-Isochrysis_galbana.AAC.5
MAQTRRSRRYVYKGAQDHHLRNTRYRRWVLKRILLVLPRAALVRAPTIACGRAVPARRPSSRQVLGRAEALWFRRATR